MSAKTNWRLTDESWLQAGFRDWLSELNDDQLRVLGNNWDNIINDAALDRINSWIIAEKTVAAIRETSAGVKNPYEETGRSGSFGGWDDPSTFGQIEMTDAVVTCMYTGVRYLLLVERSDGHGFALPGGRIEEGETAKEAAWRELGEETGLSSLFDSMMSVTATELPQRYVPDPRATDDAWAVTTPLALDLGTVSVLPLVQGADDAADALWLPAPSYEFLEEILLFPGKQIFAAHRDMLRELLDGAGKDES